jgi:hypothetical protein
MKAREVWRDGQDALPRAESIEGLNQARAQVIGLELVANGAACEVEHGRESPEQQATKGEQPTGIEAALL